MAKKIEMFNEETTQAIQKMNIVSKYKIIGSDSYKGLLYTSDIDLQGDLKGNTEDKILTYFQSLFKSNGFKKKEWLFMDFKCGLDDRLIFKEGDDLTKYLDNPLIEPKIKNDIMKSTGEERIKNIKSLFILRWSVDDILNGKVKLIDGTFKLFVDCLKDNTMIKLDIAVAHGDTFIDINEVYTYKQKVVSNKQLILDLEDDIELYHHQNTLKSLKRLYSLLLLKNTKKKLQKQLVELFNSSIGFANKLKNDIEFFLDITEKHHLSFDIIKSNLQIFKEKYFKLDSSKNKFVTKLNNATVNNYSKVLKELVDVLRVSINTETKERFSKMDK